MRVTTYLVSLLLAAAGADALASPGPFRQLPFDRALAAARAEKKPLLVKFTASWCSSCKVLEFKTMGRPDVRRFLQRRFVAIRVDGEKGNGPALMRRYHVVGFPTVVVIDKNGREIDRVFDTPEPDAFLTLLGAMLQGRGTLAELARRVRKNPHDLRLKADLGARLAFRGRKEEAVDHLADVVNGDLDNARGLASRALLVMGKYLFLRGQRNAGLAQRILEKLIQAFPKSPEAASAYYSLAVAHARLGRARIGERLLKMRIGAYRGAAKTYNALAWFHFRARNDVAAAIRVARKGLKRSPTAAGLWDSYSEFLWSAGDRWGALKAARKGLELAPGDAYYQYQVRRFERAVGGSPGGRNAGVRTTTRGAR